ncbi:AFH_G0050170.mRNA.1.CDS.1 [Saccharomyces cerevisiae]|nr:AFH_G0050170.mRNA.1.CDS.1 [Saccharomyces cerevisiae]CAI6884190.1 AFH_G0050170.mRNA.1.CDS.1 [Saccharomyces cerevisiae]
MSQMSSTISNCGFATGMDMAGLLPKYVDIKRGALFCACISWACLPWNFYNSSSTFLTVMSSFGVVMTPIIAVMICDNFLIRKRQYSITNAFILKGEYYFTKGVNWRAIVAWVCGMAPGLPGIAWEVNNNYFHDSDLTIWEYYQIDPQLQILYCQVCLW